MTAITTTSAAAEPAGAASPRQPVSGSGPLRLNPAGHDDYPQPGQAFMSTLVTEHFVVQSARSTTVSEAVGRAAVYLTCVSSSLVAFGFFAAATRHLAPWWGRCCLP